MLKETSVQLFGNDRFEGFAIDLIHELSLMEGFNYTFLIRADKSNGKKNQTTGQWSGMIGDVMEGVNKTELLLHFFYLVVLGSRFSNYRFDDNSRKRRSSRFYFTIYEFRYFILFFSVPLSYAQ